MERYDIAIIGTGPAGLEAGGTGGCDHSEDPQ